MLLVLDTGILIGALITKGTPPDRLYEAWCQAKFELVTSQAQLNELSRVVTYPKLQRYIKPLEANQLLVGLKARATVLEQILEVDYSPDPDDNKIIATAIAGQADYIISGDKRDLLSLKEVERIPIISAREAIETIV